MTTKIYNVEYTILDLEFIKGDTIDITLQIFKNNIAFDMSGMIVKMQVKDTTVAANLIKSFDSDLDNKITINGTSFRIFDTGFNISGSFIYDIQIINSNDIFTIVRGLVIVLDETSL